MRCGSGAADECHGSGAACVRVLNHVAKTVTVSMMRIALRQHAAAICRVAHDRRKPGLFWPRAEGWAPDRLLKSAVLRFLNTPSPAHVRTRFRRMFFNTQLNRWNGADLRCPGHNHPAELCAVGSCQAFQFEFPGPQTLRPCGERLCSFRIERGSPHG